MQTFAAWQKMEEPDWQYVQYKKIDYQSISYFAAPKKKYDSIDDVDPEILETFEKLGIPLHERAALAGVAVDAVNGQRAPAIAIREEVRDDDQDAAAGAAVGRQTGEGRIEVGPP